MSTMFNSPTKLTAGRRRDAIRPGQMPTTPLVHRGIPTIDLFLLTLSLTLLIAVFTLGIRI